MADELLYDTDRVRFEAPEGQVLSKSATDVFVINHRFVAGCGRWDRFFGYWPLRARDEAIEKIPPQPDPTCPSAFDEIAGKD